jgi:hypothetical protein
MRSLRGGTCGRHNALQICAPCSTCCCPLRKRIRRTACCGASPCSETAASWPQFCRSHPVTPRVRATFACTMHNLYAAAACNIAPTSSAVTPSAALLGGSQLLCFHCRNVQLTSSGAPRPRCQAAPSGPRSLVLLPGQISAAPKCPCLGASALNYDGDEVVQGARLLGGLMQAQTRRLACLGKCVCHAGNNGSHLVQRPRQRRQCINDSYQQPSLPCWPSKASWSNSPGRAFLVKLISGQTQETGILG